MQPTPLTYLMAIGVGVVLGVVLDLAVGWPWWIVTASLVALVWLVFLTSAFRGPDNDLGHQLLRVFNPERAVARDRRRIEDAISSGSLIAYEVSGWEGEKSIAGWSGAPVPRSLTIRHGDRFPEETAWIEVTTHAGEEADFAGAWVEEELKRRLADSQLPLPVEPTVEDLRQRQRDLYDVEPPAWRSQSFEMDQELVLGQIASAGDHWVGYARTGTVLVDMVANAIVPEMLRLTRVVDVDRSGLGRASENDQS